jgi:hypothetical protein
MRAGRGKRHVVVVALGALAVFAGCSGTVGDSCRDESDCRGDLYCRGPDDGPACGIGPREQCASDADCIDSVCHAVADYCSADGIGSECGTPCSEVACPDGFRCSVGSACEPIPCDEGFACPAYQRCDPAAAHASAPVHALTHGCVSIPCSLDERDADCPAGTVCTNGVCQSGAGTCQEVQLVP